MKRLFLLLFFVYPALCHSESEIIRPYPTLKEVDGIPELRYPTIRVPNGSLIDGTTEAWLLCSSTDSSSSVSYIQNRSTLQSNATFFVSSGTVQNFRSDSSTSGFYSGDGRFLTNLSTQSISVEEFNIFKSSFETTSASISSLTVRGTITSTSGFVGGDFTGNAGTFNKVRLSTAIQPLDFTKLDLYSRGDLFKGAEPITGKSPDEDYYVFGSSWFQVSVARDYKGVAVSASGRYQTAVVENGQIYVSSDYGKNFYPRMSNAKWYRVVMTPDGLVQAACVRPGQIYISTDLWNTWATVGESKTWNGLAISADGYRISAVPLSGHIYISTDIGQTWTEKLTDSNRSWNGISISADGVYQTAPNYNGLIYISSDSGATWGSFGASKLWYDNAMSDDGRVQVAVSFGDGGSLQTSDDYGQTWTERRTGNLITIAMSGSGSRMLASQNSGQPIVSTDTGRSWRAIGDAHTWSRVGMSYDGEYLMGSASEGIFTCSNQKMRFADIYARTHGGLSIRNFDGTKAMQITDNADVIVSSLTSYGTITSSTGFVGGNFAGNSFTGNTGAFSEIYASTVNTWQLYVTSYAVAVIQSTSASMDYLAALNYDNVTVLDDLNMNENPILNCPTIYNSTAALQSMVTSTYSALYSNLQSTGVSLSTFWVSANSTWTALTSTGVSLTNLWTGVNSTYSALASTGVSLTNLTNDFNLFSSSFETTAARISSLTVYSTITSSTGFRGGQSTFTFVHDTGGAYFGGNVGLGTTNPQSRLELVSNSTIVMNDGFINARTASDVNHGMKYNSTADGPEFRGYTGFIWKTGTAGATERMRMNATGVGIGTTTADSTLTVNGTFRVSNSAVGSAISQIEHGNTTKGTTGIGAYKHTVNVGTEWATTNTRIAARISERVNGSSEADFGLVVLTINDMYVESDGDLHFRFTQSVDGTGVTAYIDYILMR